MAYHSADDIKGIGVAGVRGVPLGLAGAGFGGVGGRSGGDGLALDLQFAVDKTLTARKGPTPTFTRASSGTFVGSDGLVQTAATDVARFDHDPVTLVSKGLLIEESRTNLSLYSGALVVGTGWASGETTSTTSGNGPDGNTSYQVSETSATGIHTIANSGGLTATAATSVTSGTVYTGSIFLKKVTGSVDWVQLTLGSAGFGTAQYANFNIRNGTVGNSAGLASGTSPRIENYGNGWYRCSISAAATSTATTLNLVTAFVNNTNGTTRTPSYAGSTSNSVLAAMCQLEAGSFATSYIPTTTSALARSADVCSITGAAFSGMWNAPEGSIFVDSAFNAPTSYSGQRIWEATSSNGASLVRSFRSSLVSGGITFRNTKNNTQDVVITSNAIQPLLRTKQSYGLAENNFTFYLNGAQVGTDTNCSMSADLSELHIGINAPLIGGGQLNGTLASIRYYRKRLPNTKLQALTV